MAIQSKVRRGSHEYGQDLLSTLYEGDVKHMVYVCLVITGLAWLLVKRYIEGRSSSTTAKRVPDPESTTLKPGYPSPPPSKPVRPLGVWPVSDFKRPAAKPLLNWEVHQTAPRPYRPFRWGPYHITMGLRTMQWDEWIELDNHYLKYHADKNRRIQERSSKCCRTAPEAMDGAIELLEEL